MRYLTGGLIGVMLLLFSGAIAQEKFVTLTGKISDRHTHLPIPFVSIQLKSGSVGTSSNQDGEFIFKIAESLGKDTLVLSSIGYRSLKVPLSNVGRNLSLSLEPAVIELAEVTVNATTGLDLFKKALAKIPENYDTSNVQLTAFYRENVWLGDVELSFSESVLEVFRTFKVAKAPNDQIRILKGRKKKIDYGKEGQLYFWLSGPANGARGSLAEDQIKYRNAKYSPFNPSNYRYYNYDYVETIKDGDRDIIVLSILPKKKSSKALLDMKLFIEEESLAIVRIDFSINEKGLRFVERKDKGVMQSIMSAVTHAHLDYHKFEYTLTYKKYNSKLYLNRVLRHWEILVDSKKRNWEDRVLRFDMDFVTTNIDTKNVKPITEGDIGKTETPIGVLMGNDFDEAFWENYNTIKAVTVDSLKMKLKEIKPDTVKKKTVHVSNRQNGFTRGDTLRGKLTPLRTCYDVTFYHLDADVDLDKRSIKGNNLIRYKVIEPFRKMQIDLYDNMKIEKIIHKGKALTYSREYNAVFVEFPEDQKKGTQSEIKVYYEGIPQTPDFSIPMNGGVLWDKDSLGNPWAQVVCQGSGASLWWPNKDHQSDEPDSMKIWITIPSAFTDVSNGRLIRKTSMPNNKTRYEWYVSYPINNYNVTFGIGKYAHFTDRYISDDTLTIDYYVMQYNVERAKKMFLQVKPMLEAFEKNFGKYPFKRDGFTLVESPYPMEHQSGVCIGKIDHKSSGDTNPLMWHEAAHEWWGNSITSKDIADMWIHEAFATYAEVQVVEHRFGKEAADTWILEQVDAVRGEEPVIGVYDVNHIFYDISDMYSKGSLMLHTFRNVLNNDTLWVNLLRDIQKHFRYQTITSDQLVAFICQRTKTDYTYFFDQYLKHTNLPALELTFEENETELLVRYRWAADVKDFRMPVRVTTKPGAFSFVYPTTEWKVMKLKDMTEAEFEVDEERFYIDVQLD
jgi:hypothetical protein